MESAINRTLLPLGPVQSIASISDPILLIERPNIEQGRKQITAVMKEILVKGNIIGQSDAVPWKALSSRLQHIG